jgi:tetrahydromethanopterin S-methyltransferase subunit B
MEQLRPQRFDVDSLASRKLRKFAEGQTVVVEVNEDVVVEVNEDNVVVDVHPATKTCERIPVRVVLLVLSMRPRI